MTQRKLEERAQAHLDTFPADETWLFLHAVRLQARGRQPVEYLKEK